MKHKTIVLFLLLVIICWSFSYGSSKDFSLEAAYTSRYIWCGFDLLPNNHGAAQFSLKYRFRESGLWINFWSSFGINERTSTKSADELDYIVGYDISLGKGFMDFSTGLTYYTYPNLPGKNTFPEIFISLLFSEVFYSLVFTTYYDMNLGNGLLYSVLFPNR